MSLLFLNLVLFVIILFLLIILSWVWPPDSPWAPWWRTSKEKARAVCRLAKINKNDIVYELGCGEGNTLIVAATEFGAQGVGIEIDPLRAFLSTLILYRNKVNDRVVIKRKNFFVEDISRATVIFVYLVPKTLNRLVPKFKKELKKGTRIVSYRYEVPLPLKRFDKKNNLRLYIIS